MPPEADIDELIVGIVGGPLEAAGYVRTDLNWVHSTPGSLAAFTAVRSDDPLAYSIAFGWRFDALGDPDPEPVTAHGCVRFLTLDELSQSPGPPIGAVGGRTPTDNLGFEQRLATVVRKDVIPWIEPWKRAEGFRDFLAARNYHLAAAWASALLGQGERARLELAYAGHLYHQELDDGFDRRRADQDGALAVVLASRNGLATLLGEASEETVGAFDSVRGASVREKVVNPLAEHRRLQLRHQAFADTCVRFLTRS